MADDSTSHLAHKRLQTGASLTLKHIRLALVVQCYLQRFPVCTGTDKVFDTSMPQLTNLTPAMDSAVHKPARQGCPGNRLQLQPA